MSEWFNMSDDELIEGVSKGDWFRWIIRNKHAFYCRCLQIIAKRVLENTKALDHKSD